MLAAVLPVQLLQLHSALLQHRALRVAAHRSCESCNIAATGTAWSSGSCRAVLWGVQHQQQGPRQQLPAAPWSLPGKGAQPCQIIAQRKFRAVCRFCQGSQLPRPAGNGRPGSHSSC